MKVKSLALGVGILAVVTAAAWYFTRDTGGPVADARIGQPLLDDATIAAAGGLFVRSGTNEVTLAGIEPAALKAGVVKDYHDLPADFGKVSRLIDDLRKKESGVTRVIGSNPERLAKLGFGGDRIELRDKDGKALWTLHLGSNPEKGGRFVKFGDDPKAYLCGLSTWIDPVAKNWADAALVGAKAEDVVGIEVRLADGGTLTATRVDGKGVWKCPELAEGESLKESEWTSLAGKLAGLRFMDTRDPETLETIAARPTARSYRITLLDGRSFTITASQRQDPPPPAPETPPAEGATPPAPQPQPADVFVQSGRAEDPVNALMGRRSFQVAEWTFSGLPTTRDALVNVPTPPAPAAPATPADAAAAAAPTDGAAPAEAGTPAEAATPAESAPAAPGETGATSAPAAEASTAPAP